MQLDDEMMVMTLRPEHEAPAADDARRRAALRTGLILATIAAVFFVGIIVKIGLLGA
ncbi:cytochrome oxidase small assembly protein [Derxia gummosa]|uniref:Cytochrome oxidase small assembly protein n=1 Tax=Derxia gummosa DSM 723 TaxID=1121388 RepID=A0A8B6XCN6_9BURK|nr:cytochrome oxidase small assembly protein [Derxia gummosa]